MATFLGFVFDSVDMSISLPREKELRVIELCEKLEAMNKPTIREAAKVIGFLVASFPAVRYGKLHYRNLERDKVKALAKHKGDYDGYILFSPLGLAELRWWRLNVVNHSSSPLSQGAIGVWVTSDASFTGWGGTVRLTNNGLRTTAVRPILQDRSEVPVPLVLEDRSEVSQNVFSFVAPQ